MKWNGTVSQCEKITIAARLATEKAAHATSTQANGQWTRGRWTGHRSAGGRCGHRMARWGNGSLADRAASPGWAARRGCVARRARPGRCLGGEPISLTAHRLDQVEAELGPQPPNADVHHVRARVEVVAPDRGQQLALAHRLARVLDQLSQ